MDRKIRVRIPIVAIGNSEGVELGGVLNIVRRELEVLCLPMAIPESIELDVTELGIGDSIHVEDITLDGDVEIPADTNFTVLTINTPKVEEEEVEEEEEGLEGEEGAEGEGAEGEPSAEGAAEAADAE
jgi:large subunit ribosomal protein L25